MIVGRGPLFLEDEILPSYLGIFIRHHKDPYKPTRIFPGMTGQGEKTLQRCHFKFQDDLPWGQDYMYIQEQSLWGKVGLVKLG